jgi:stage III sporulation protein AD
MSQVCALALVAALSFFILSELKWRGAPVLVILCFVGVLSVAGSYLKEVGGAITYIAQSSGTTEAAAAVLKVVGVGYLAGISSDVCSELGASRIGNAVTLVGRLEIIAIATPFFVKILDMGVELIG